jgi:hypothetical protein
MVVAARREKEGARILPDDLIETQRLVVEPAGLIEVAHAEVNVSYRGPCRRARPRLQPALERTPNPHLVGADPAD